MDESNELHRRFTLINLSHISILHNPLEEENVEEYLWSSQGLSHQYSKALQLSIKKQFYKFCTYPPDDESKFSVCTGLLILCTSQTLTSRLLDCKNIQHFYYLYHLLTYLFISTAQIHQTLGRAANIHFAII